MKNKMELEYYTNQLETVSGKSTEYPRNFQIRDNGKQTKWLSLNDESANQLVKYLIKHYNILNNQ